LLLLLLALLLLLLLTDQLMNSVQILRTGTRLDNSQILLVQRRKGTTGAKLSLLSAVAGAIPFAIVTKP
jgi:hypothetical protein